MPGQAREPVPEPEQPAHGAPGNAGTGPVPSAAGLDWQALLEALAAGGLLEVDPDGQDGQDAVAGGRMSAPLPAGQAGALAVEHMDPGPAQAGWLALAAAEATRLDEYQLAGVAIAARRLASWAQAAELSAVAQITARAAAADSRIGLKSAGRPGRLCRDAVGQVSLALMLTDHSATAWADLAITLAWRLPATGQALAGGVIDLARARVIAEATSVLGEDAARAVEATVLPEAGRQTTAQLRVRLRRAVIAADPDGAERRREEAERQAKVSLYADDDGTATLAGAGLPAVEAAAAMARITAIARTMKAAGQGGGLDLHRARVMLGLLLGTLPYIPPPGGAPEPPPPGDGDSPGDGSGPAGDPGGPDGGQPDDLPDPRDEDAPPDEDPLSGDSPDKDIPGGGLGDGSGVDDDDWPGAGPVPTWPGLGAVPPALAWHPAPSGGRPAPGLLDLTLPWATLADLSAAPGLLGRTGPITAAQARQLATAASADPAAQWRIIVTNPAGQAITVIRIPRRTRGGPGPGRGHPPPGAGLAGRVTLTITQDTIRDHTTGRPSPASGPGPPAGAARPGPASGTALPARVARPGPLAGIAAAALRAAARALDQALARAAADAAAGGCAHHAQSDAYRPPPRLREHITARDVTCRNPACRAARLARRPRPHPALGGRRTHLLLQPGRRLPPPPPAQTTPPLEAGAGPARPLHLDHAGRTDVYHQPRHPPAVAIFGREQVRQRPSARDSGP